MSRNMQGKNACPDCGSLLAFNGKWMCNVCQKVVTNPTTQKTESDASKDERIARLIAQLDAYKNAPTVADMEDAIKEIDRLRDLCAERTGTIQSMESRIDHVMQELEESRNATSVATTHPAEEELKAMRDALTELATGNSTKADLIAEITKLASAE